MDEKFGGLKEWLYPLAFMVCAGWAIWHIPAFLLDLVPPANESLFSQISELQIRKDVAPNIPSPFGGRADILDWMSVLALPVLFFFGARSLVVANMEYQEWRPIDRIAMFVGRITMILIISMTLIMLYEVFLRYALETPTLWANELTLWIAGFVFLLSGFYAMQQRCHIRIFLLYDMAPRSIQHVFDVISTATFAIFAFFLVFGSYKQVFINKFYKWEMFGTAFDPPIPATLQPMILIIVPLIALQSIINLIADWDQEPTIHTGMTDMDEDELESIKHSVGAD